MNSNFPSDFQEGTVLPSSLTIKEALFIKKDSWEKEEVIQIINLVRNEIVKSSSWLTTFDGRTEMITKPLQYYKNGFSLGKIGEACLKSCDASRKLFLSEGKINLFLQSVPSIHIPTSIVLFSLHEACHIGQGIKMYEDVAKLKEITGSEKIGQLDLQSDFLAAHILSLIYTYKNNNQNHKEEDYLLILHKLWCESSMATINIFPCAKKRVKQQRVLGFLVMASLINYAYLNKLPLIIDSELWPDWNQSLDQIVIFGRDGKISLPPMSIAPELMESILKTLSEGDYRQSFSLVDNFCRRNILCFNHTLIGTSIR